VEAPAQQENELVRQHRQPNHQPQYNVPLKPDQQPTTVEPKPQTTETPAGQKEVTRPETQPDWETIARQQQMEMDNFRRRQTRRADEAITAEKERILRLILPVADNLERALQQSASNTNTLHQGVELIQRELERVLEAEGVTRMETVDTIFDPNWHEAIASQPADTESNTIINEIEAGYNLTGKLLRPAKVVVAS
jgi:molecular chaperone GrpE